MISVLVSSVVYRWFKHRSSQTQYNKNGICCFSFKQPGLRLKSKDWFARNQDHVSEWREMSTCQLLFQCASPKKKDPIKHFGLLQNEYHHHLIEI